MLNDVNIQGFVKMKAFNGYIWLTLKVAMMKNKLMTLAMFAAIGLFSVNASASNYSVATGATIECDGGHECTDKCKKDENGKCADAKATANGEKGETPSCCSKSEKSCHGKKGKAEGKQKSKESKTTKS